MKVQMGCRTVLIGIVIIIALSVDLMIAGLCLYVAAQKNAVME